MITIPDFWRAGKDSRLLVVSIGNTHARFGWFEGDLLRHTEAIASADLGTTPPPPPNPGPIGVVSVVPEASAALARAWSALPVRILSPEGAGMTVRYHPAASLGADRLANAIALVEKGWLPAVAVDCGTATTFTVIDEAGAIVGGAIAPGLGTAARALIGNTAQLLEVPFEHHPAAWGADTIACLQLGIVEGHVGMIAHMVRRFAAGLTAPPQVVLCGGWSELLAERLPTYRCEPFLTLEGGRAFRTKIR